MSDDMTPTPETPTPQTEPKAPAQPTEDPVALKANLEKIQRERDGLYARAKQAEEENKTLKSQIPPKDPVAKDDLEERVDLRLAGHTAEEISFIKRNAKPGQSLLEAAKDPFVVAAIEGLRSKAKAEQATPAPSRRAPVKPGEKVETPSFAEWRAARSRKG